MTAGRTPAPRSNAARRLVELALSLTALEAAALATYHRSTGRGVAPADLAGDLLAGACLMAALRAASGGARLLPTAAWLTAAGLSHAAAVHRRWR